MIAEELVENEKYKEKKGLSIASLVLGIVGIPFSWLYYISLPCSILAIIFGVNGYKHNGMKRALTGLILGIVGTTITVFIYATFTMLAICYNFLY